MSEKPKKYRRSYWIDGKVQWPIIQKTLMMNVALVFLLYLADKFFFYRMELMGKDLGFTPDHVYFMFLKEQQKIKFMAFLCTSGIITVVASLLGARFSHRLAGPIFRLRKELRSINNDEKIGEVNLRDADFFKDLAEEFNTMTLKFGMRKTKEEFEAEKAAKKSEQDAA